MPNLPVSHKLIILLVLAHMAFASSFAETIKSNYLYEEQNQQDTLMATIHHDGENTATNDEFSVINIPFPPNTLHDKNSISVTSMKGKKLSTYTEVLSNWNFIDESEKTSIRSLKVYLENPPGQTFPAKITIKLNSQEPSNFKKAPKGVSEWNKKTISIETKDNEKSFTIKTPRTYATYSPEWLSNCLLRTKTIAVGETKNLSWFDEAFIKGSEAVFNEMNNTSLTNHEFSILAHRTWQYDLPATLFNAYIRTGHVKWLKQAHIATQIYASYLNDEGIWTLKDKPDLKFSYNLSMFIDYLLLGDKTLIPKIENVATYTSNWRENYKRSYGFWTERHQTYSLLGSLVAWEATGKSHYADRAKLVAKASYNLAVNPAGDWEAIGCLQHEFGSHAREEGGNSQTPVCSPWMSALLADALIRYYIQSSDSDALELIYQLSDFVSNYGLYTSDKRHVAGFSLPKYIASQHELSYGSDPWGDRHHSCDVAALLAKGIWAGNKAEKNTAHINKAMKGLLNTCENILSRESFKSSKTGKNYLRLKPPRKYSWWFGTTSDFSYFYSNL